MNSRFCRAHLILSVSLVFLSNVSARDFNSWKLNKDSAYENNFQAATSSPDLINWPTYVGTLRTGKINASFNCFADFYDFSTPPDSGAEYMWSGTIWIGGIVEKDTLVSVGFDSYYSNQEFAPPEYNKPVPKGSVNKIDYITDFSLRAEFSDTAASRGWYSPLDPLHHRPLNLKISNRSHTWRSAPQNNIIIYDMVITNVGNKTIDEGCIGFYFDCEVGSYQTPEYYLDDLAGSIHNNGIGYAIDNNGDLDSSYAPVTRVFAFKFLQNSFNGKDTSFNWWASTYYYEEPQIDFGPRQRGTSINPFRDVQTDPKGSPDGDANKYYVMKFREWDYDQIQTYSIPENDPVWLEPNPAIDADLSDGYDTRFLMSISPFQLPPDSSIRVLFTTFTGDYVHTTGASSNYLPEDPVTYYSLLYFNDVIANAARADSLAELLLDPNLPPIGLQVVKKPDNSHELQWDPWVYDDVVGYHVFISEANLDTLPHPGVIPPWWRTNADENPIVLGKTYKLDINQLDPEKHFIASIAHDLGNSIGELSAPIQFKFNPKKAAPPIPSRHAFANPGGPLALKWSLPTDKSSVDHFNIYKFSSKALALNAYHARYDEGYFAQFFPPKDTVLIGEKKYYFYSMEPYAVGGANDTVFFDPDVIEGQVYIISSADQFGFESEFTEPITANVVDVMTRDILLITNSQVVTPNNFTYIDSVYSFYNRVLDGYDYEIYSNRDSTNITYCPSQNVKCMDWHDFMRFKMVIVDDHLSEAFFSALYQDSTDGFVRYLGYGGKLVYFGRFRGFGFNSQYGTMLNYMPIDHEFVNNFLGIDSLMFSGERYYHNFTSAPYFDTLFGFIEAVQADSVFSTIKIDTLRDPFAPRLRTHWEHKTPPGVATFKLNHQADTSHLFNSIYPLKSLQQNHVVGARRNFPEANTFAYTFGFHLWYMDLVDAQLLIETLFGFSSALGAQTRIEPTHFRTINLNSSSQSTANIYLWNLGQSRNDTEIDFNSIVLNYSLTPQSAEVIPFLEGYDLDVLKLKFPIWDVVSSYGPVWDTLITTYTINGRLYDNSPFLLTGPIMIIGRFRGDINEDLTVNVLDLTFLVDYLFRSQPLPAPSDAADVDGNGRINIIDLTKLVDLIFRGEDL